MATRGPQNGQKGLLPPILLNKFLSLGAILLEKVVTEKKKRIVKIAVASRTPELFFYHVQDQCHRHKCYIYGKDKTIFHIFEQDNELQYSYQSHKNRLFLGSQENIGCYNFIHWSQFATHALLYSYCQCLCHRNNDICLQKNSC